MRILQKRYSILFKAIAIAIVCIFLANNTTFSISANVTNLPLASTLAVMSANERGIPHQMRALAYREEFDQKLSPLHGGKNAWDTVLEKLAEKIGFAVPGSIRFMIRDVWGKFIETNRVLIDEGNALIKADLIAHGKVTGETIEKLRNLSRQFVFPKELELLIQSRTEELKGWVIARSSGRHEDSYLRNLAGIFISPRKKDERLVVQGVKEIFAHAIGRIWIAENEKDTKTEGIPNLLTPEDGFGILIQPFLQFKASGTAMTNRYGHTSIEAAIGDAEMAVRGIHANVAQFLFKKSDPAHFEYNPSFLTMPYQIRLKDKEYSIEKDHDAMKTILNSCPKVDGKASPITEAQAKELYRVISALEDEIGVPLDVEWGFLYGRLYIIQIRPDIGDFKKPLVEMSQGLKDKTPIAQTPIALGHTKPDGFTARAVVFGSGVTKETVGQFENEYAEDYIRIQRDVASAILDAKTMAKVLVDPDQGSRQAHNINLISDRIANDEFAYCNGPVLKDGLLRNLHFSPHPTLEGIWLSDEEVTYFCDGLKAQFYAGQIKRTPIPFELKVEWDIINYKLGGLRDKVLTSASEIGQVNAEQIAKEILEESGLDEAMSAEDFPKAEKSGLINEAKLLKLVLDFPLLPNDWDLDWLSILRRSLDGYLKDYNRYLEAKKEADSKRDESKRVGLISGKDQFHALIYDYHAGYYEDVEKSLAENDRCVVNRVSVVDGDGKILSNDNEDKRSFRWKTMEDIAARADYHIDFMLIHIGGDSNWPSVQRLVKEVKAKEPNALIIITNKDRDTIAQKACEALDVVYMSEDKFSIDDFIKEANLHYAKWLEMHKTPQPQALPVKPENLKILVVQDDPDRMRIFKTFLKEDFGLREIDAKRVEGNGFEVFFASGAGEANAILDRENINWVVLDWILGGQPAVIVMNKIIEKGIAVDINSVDIDNYGEAKKHYPDIDIGRFPMRYDEKASRIKAMRQKQLETYEQAVAESRAAQPAPQSQVPLAKPEKPEKFRVLIASDRDVNAELIADIKNALGTDEYEFYFAIDYEKAFNIVSSHDVDGVIADWVMPDDRDTVSGRLSSSLFFRQLKNVPNIKIVTAGEHDTIKRFLRSAIGKDAAKRVRYGPQGINADSAGKLIKEWRQNQLKAYEEELAKWQTAQTAIHPSAQVAAPTKPEKLRVLFIQDREGPDHVLWAETVQDQLGRDSEYEILSASNMAEANKLAAGKKIDCCIADWTGTGVSASLERIYKLFGGRVYGFEINTLANMMPDLIKDRVYQAGFLRNDPVVVNTNGEVSFMNTLKSARQRQIESYEKSLAEWQAKQPQQQTAVPVKRAFTKNVQILVVHDEDDMIEKIKTLLKDSLGVREKSPDCLEGEGYTVFFANETKKAEEFIREHRIEYVIADWVLDKGAECADKVFKYARGFGGLKRIGIITAAPHYIDTARGACKNIEIDELPSDIGRWFEGENQKLIAYFKGIQEEHVRRYSVLLTTPRPEKPKKLKVMFMDEDIRGYGIDELRRTVGTDEYQFFFADSYASALRQMEFEDMDFIVLDITMDNPHPSIVKEYGDVFGKLTEKSKLVVTTGLSAIGAREELRKRFRESLAYAIPLYDKPMSTEGKAGLLRKYRREQLKDHEWTLADWDAVHAPKTQLSTQSQPLPVMPARPGKMKVLYIEDDTLMIEMIRDVFSGNLDKTGFELTSVSNVADASTAMNRESFDCVIFDVSVPDLNKSFQRRFLKIPRVIIYTALDEGDLKKKIEKELIDKSVYLDKFPVKGKGAEERLVALLEEWRQGQLAKYEKALAEWQVQQLKPTPSVARPEKPEKLRALFIDDEQDLTEDITTISENDWPEFKIETANSGSAAADMLSKSKYDVIIYDIRLPDIDSIKGKLMEVDSLLIPESGLREDRASKEVGEKLFKKSYQYLSKPWGTQELFYILKEIRKQQITEYEKSLAKWQATQPKQEPTAVAKGETIFVIGTNSAETPALARFIARQKGPEYKVQNYVDFISDEPAPFRIVALTEKEETYFLKQSLKWASPDIVVSDTHLDGKDCAQNIMQSVLEKNPQAKIIFTSEEAAITETQPKGDNVLAVLEKPFHFHDVVDVLNGTYADRVSAAGIRFKIEESANVINSVEKAHTIDKPGIIKIWQGYAAPKFQKSMLTRIRTKTEKGPYQIGFDKDIDNLIDFACREAKNDNAVTILPSNKLTDKQRKRLDSAGAHVIFIDLKDGIELGTDDIVQLGTIVFTGIAYLNNNNNALMRLYKLLTGKRHDPITVEELKKNPNLLIFIFEPTTVHNYNELKRLNDLMEEQILKAA